MCALVVLHVSIYFNATTTTNRMFITLLYITTNIVSTYEKVIGGLDKVLIHYMEAGAPKENKVLYLNHSRK